MRWGQRGACGGTVRRPWHGSAKLAAHKAIAPNTPFPGPLRPPGTSLIRHSQRAVRTIPVKTAEEVLQ